MLMIPKTNEHDLEKEEEGKTPFCFPVINLLGSWGFMLIVTINWVLGKRPPSPCLAVKVYI